jgi:hypothetical protein
MTVGIPTVLHVGLEISQIMEEGRPNGAESRQPQDSRLVEAAVVDWRMSRRIDSGDGCYLTDHCVEIGQLVEVNCSPRVADCPNGSRLPAM